MRPWFIFALLMLGGCDTKHDDRASLPPVRPYGGDPTNYTASGFARFSYPVKNCSEELELRPPFSVSEDGWGDQSIRVLLDFLANPKLLTTIEDGSDAQNQISFAMPSVYRGAGMWESLNKGHALVRPVTEMKRTLASSEALKEQRGMGDTYYIGTLAPSRNIAVTCSAVNWPNPTCKAEVDATGGELRYLITFPPKAAEHLPKMIAIGDRLFAPIVKDCPNSVR